VPERLHADLITLAEHEQVVAARQQAVHAASAKISAEVETFVADCVASLREQTAVLCEEMLQSISDGKTDGVHQKTLNRLTRFIEQFKQMNFANDAVMEEQLERVRQELLTRSAVDYRDNAKAQRTLRQGLSALADKARELSKADATELVQRFGQLGRRRFNLAA
jgi:flagellar biosynthesis/type III secretory pathway chaperone